MQSQNGIRIPTYVACGLQAKNMKYNLLCFPQTQTYKRLISSIFIYIKNQFGSYDVFVLSKLFLLTVRPYQSHYILSDAYGRTALLIF